jgi:outer membrane protein assembly factor BamB
MTRLPVNFPLQERWCVTNDLLISRALYSDDLVFTISSMLETSQYSYQAYNAKTGNIEWQIQQDNRDGSVGSFGFWAVDKSWLIVSSPTLAVMETETGKTLWHQNGDFRGFSVGDNKVFAATPEFVAAYEISTGKQLWQVPGPSRGTAEAPHYDPENKVLVGDYINYYVWAPDTGEVLLQAPRLKVSSPYGFGNMGQIYNGMLLYGDEAFDVLTGRLLHPFTIHDVRATTPFISENLLFLNAYDQVIAEDLTTFTTTWEYQSFDSSGHLLDILGGPVVLDKIVYVLLSDATLRALELKTGKEIGIWSGSGVVDRRFLQTPFIADLKVGEDILIASFGTNELCIFETVN